MLIDVGVNVLINVGVNVLIDVGANEGVNEGDNVDIFDDGKGIDETIDMYSLNLSDFEYATDDLIWYAEYDIETVLIIDK